jgi:hypothetical protein
MFLNFNIVFFIIIIKKNVIIYNIKNTKDINAFDDLMYNLTAARLSFWRGNNIMHSQYSQEACDFNYRNKVNLRK